MTQSENSVNQTFQVNFSHNYPYLGGYLVLITIIFYNIGIMGIGPALMFGVGCYVIILSKNNSFEVGAQALAMYNPWRVIKKKRVSYAYGEVEKMEIYSHQHSRNNGIYLRIHLKNGSKKAHTITLNEWAKPLATALEAQGVRVVLNL